MMSILNAKAKRPMWKVSVSKSVWIVTFVALIACVRSQAAVVTPLEVPDDERAFLLALQKPTILSAVDAGASTVEYPRGLMTTTVGFKTGPNSFPYSYTVRCYPIEETSPGVYADAPTCADLPAQVGETQSGRLPLRYASVEVEYPVEGLDAPGVDCFVTVSGSSGKNFKCSYAGRAIAPAVETIRCLDIAAGNSFWVNGREIRIVQNSPDRYGTPVYGPDDFEYYVWGGSGDVFFGEVGEFWPELPNICTSNVQDMSRSFYGATENVFGITDANYDITQWDTQRVVTMTSMFEGATYFNQQIGSWNTSRVGPTVPPICDVSNIACYLFDMQAMFGRAPSFNGTIGSWDVSSVTDMAGMFLNATSFNQNIGAWKTGNVVSMFNMFDGATAFNQNIDTDGAAWDVSSVTSMDSMFSGATSFNQNLINWDPNFTATDGTDCLNFAKGATAWLAYWSGINVGVYPLDTTPPLSSTLRTAGCGQQQQ